MQFVGRLFGYDFMFGLLGFFTFEAIAERGQKAKTTERVNPLSGCVN
jgi:hypothetical protein